MAFYDKDEVPMLSDIHPQSSENNKDSRFQTFFSRTQSASISIPMHSIESYENTNLVGHTGPLRNERKTPFIQMSGPLYISRKPENSFYLNQNAAGRKMVESKAEKFPSFNGMDEKDWSDNNYVGKNEHLLRSGQLGMCNDPYCTTCPTYYNFKAEQQKNSKASGIFDAKFHNALYGDAKGWARRLMSFLHTFVPGVMNPHAKVVQQWNKFFAISCLMAVFIDPLFFFLLSVQKDNKCMVINWPATKAFVVLRSMTDCIYILNMLLQFRLAYIAPESRVVGAGELVDHPKKIAVNYLSGYFFLDLFVVLPFPQIMISFVLPKYLGSEGANYAKSILCTAILIQYLPRLYRFLPFLAGQSPRGFIFESAWENFVINLLTFMLSGHVVGSCWYLFGLQQISTLAGNQTPSYFIWEVLFTMAIVGLGLLLFALLIGNMQNFLQALGRRRLEMSLRRRDVEQWMSHRRLPAELRRKVREAERYNWAATRGVNEEMLFENLPEDLQRDIRRHLFKFVKKVRFFAILEDPILDAICERLRQKTYIKGSNVLSPGNLIERVVFIVRGKMESVGENGIKDPLSEGDVCGEELLTWCLEHSSVNRDGKKIRIPAQRLLSNRNVRCLTNVEAFSLRAADLEEVTSLFSRFLRNPRVQGAIRYESPYWRSLAATRIQVAWRYRKKCLNRSNTSQSANPLG
ncbi:probable cyclic nucleotide-gated ion channel 20, chloroplastic isoform X4 [Durio zibethinus]|uniref:Probable cyclic nucleotide-gated ion channel 20, chloroplastic isoform X4 n=1 Tax=Durio zibethinus TaxID=66656 RepID=A0A6P5XD64_DURZI|nr:probable cyclic nucleotide-gated ion channel 20, chloroplastic isoform X4 [Durio zibethinus]